MGTGQHTVHLKSLPQAWFAANTPALPLLRKSARMQVDFSIA
jgi:hypothetical protein